MANRHSIGVSELNSDLGLTVRTLQNWCDLGVLRPLRGTHRQGRGIHREFDADPAGEVALAKIAAVIGGLRIPTSRLAIITAYFRDSEQGRASILRAITGKPVLVTLTLDDFEVTSFLVSHDPCRVHFPENFPVGLVLDLSATLLGATS